MPDLDQRIARVRQACVDGDRVDPVDEATDLALRHDEGTVWFSDDAFAAVVGTELTLAVAPNARGRGIGGALVRRALEAAPTLAWSHGDHPAAADLAAAHGWERVRELWVMRRPTSLELLPVVTPSGVTIRGFEDGDEDAVLAVNRAAFAHHPEQGSLDHTGFAERTAEPWWDPAGLLLAVDDAGTLLGFHWTKQHSAALGEVYVVGVSPAAQGLGLGKVLTLAGLHHLAGLGVDEVLLYVESDNAPAVHVYSGLGFAHHRRDTHVQYAAPAPSDR